MNLKGIAAALALIVATCGCHAYAAEPEIPVSTVCPVTYPEGGVIGNDSLGVALPGGKFIFKPGGPGFVDDADGALGIKVGWERSQERDSVAPPARAYIPRSYDYYTGGMSLFLVFPTPGCWEVTGAVTSGSLTFIVEVEKIGDGPSGHMRGPPSGSRVTGFLGALR